MGLIDKGKMPKPLSWLLNFGRARSLWVYQWGLACCAIEMGAAFGSPRYDVMRLGVIPFPASPRQADLVVDIGALRPDGQVGLYVVCLVADVLEDRIEIGHRIVDDQFQLHRSRL